MIISWSDDNLAYILLSSVDDLMFKQTNKQTKVNWISKDQWLISIIYYHCQVHVSYHHRKLIDWLKGFISEISRFGPIGPI